VLIFVLSKPYEVNFGAFGKSFWLWTMYVTVSVRQVSAGWICTGFDLVLCVLFTISCLS